MERGYSQRDLAKETGISHRMIAYYEKQAQHPQTHVMSSLAKAEGYPSINYLGWKRSSQTIKTKISACGVRFNQIEKLDARKTSR
jgi:transcriptional regulator with XRE-family HTH domain